MGWESLPTQNMLGFCASGQGKQSTAMTNCVKLFHCTKKTFHFVKSCVLLKPQVKPAGFPSSQLQILLWCLFSPCFAIQTIDVPTGAFCSFAGIPSVPKFHLIPLPRGSGWKTPSCCHHFRHICSPSIVVLCSALDTCYKTIDIKHLGAIK